MYPLFRLSLLVVSLFLIIWQDTLQGANPVLGPGGINSTGLGLDGVGQLLGQVELGRPGLEFYDAAPNFNSSVFADPIELIFGARMNVGISNHAEQVAGLMVGSNADYGGAAPNASLLSGAYNTTSMGLSQVRAARTAQAILLRGPRRAINMSFGVAPSAGGPNGNDLLSQFNDWSASQFDYLPVVAGDESGVVLTVPSDHYNGLTVSMLGQTGGVYNKVSPINVFTPASNTRRLVDVAAPGAELLTAKLGNKFTRDTFTDTNNDDFWSFQWLNNNATPGLQTNVDNWLENPTGVVGQYNNVFNAGTDWYFDRNNNGVRDGGPNDDYYVMPGDTRFPAPYSEPVQDVNNDDIIDLGALGTSYAAPLVTGSIALIHQHLENEFGFFNDGQRHQVV